ncbi:hypothetical protein [Fusobacterium polymorphum]|uniref:hypothetical protein n=1 Tax=Fusobacterium nucleatum subsp. polymorphum TaxID=76857 RepID=UPI002B4C16DD|nr:hypothetical protein [Fusobacterium polymorphum]WRL75648.1 hypothetical protein VKN80_01780 [Fusobacterium polymorphum]
MEKETTIDKEYLFEKTIKLQEAEIERKNEEMKKLREELEIAKKYIKMLEEKSSDNIIISSNIKKEDEETLQTKEKIIEKSESEAISDTGVEEIKSEIEDPLYYENFKNRVNEFERDESGSHIWLNILSGIPALIILIMLNLVDGIWFNYRTYEFIYLRGSNIEARIFGFFIGLVIVRLLINKFIISVSTKNKIAKANELIKKHEILKDNIPENEFYELIPKMRKPLFVVFLINVCWDLGYWLLLIQGNAFSL